MKRAPIDASQEPVLRAGNNVWRVVKTDAVAFLVDADEYFRALNVTLRGARSSIYIVGWDFDPDIRLRPTEDNEKLGTLLRSLIEAHSELQLHILVWAIGPIYSSRTLQPFRRDGWASHPRINLRFDTRHALRGSHHQKMVAVDDTIAFVGGIDLTGGRWDTSNHTAVSRHRVKPAGQPYGPLHDVQVMLGGAAAKAVSDLARHRWEKATGEKLPSVATAKLNWPMQVIPDIADCTVGIGRTTPSLWGVRGRRETVRLTDDAIAAARRYIYIEAQYLASFRVGRALARRLRESDGPEIVILVTRSSRGLIEQFVMARNRDRLIRRLRKADRFGRLRIMYSVVADEDGNDCEILIHSKVLIIDDTFLRIGSSNLNNRSEGLDTECDVAVEAANPQERRAIATLRDRLLAEHLDVAKDKVSEAISRYSLVGTIDRLNDPPRGLRSFTIEAEGMTSPLPGTSIFDPARPFRPWKTGYQLMAAALSRLWRRVF